MNSPEKSPGSNMTLEKQKTKYFHNFAIKYLYPFRHIFLEGGTLSRGEEEEGEMKKENGNKEWRNITKHCLVAGVVANILAEHLGADSKKVTGAALLHDWYKRREVDAKANEGFNYWETVGRDKETLKNLLIKKEKLAENEAEKMVELSHANFPKKEWINKKTDNLLEINPDRSLEEKIIHFVDEIVMDSDIVPFKERILQQGKKEQGRRFYDSFKPYFGTSLDKVHMAICENDQKEFENKLGLKPGTLIDFIVNELVNRIQKTG